MPWTVDAGWRARERGGLGSFTPAFSGAAPDARAIGANVGEDDVVSDASAGFRSEQVLFVRVKNSITAEVRRIES
jgi:hypothetical protein